MLPTATDLATRRNARCRSCLGMDAGGINVVRQLPIDPALVNSMLLGLRRDTPGSATGWSLGRRGSAEVDVDFFRTGAPEPTWTATARALGPRSARGGAGCRRSDDHRNRTAASSRSAPTFRSRPGGRRACPRCSTWPGPRSTSSPKSCSGTPPATGWPATTCPNYWSGSGSADEVASVTSGEPCSRNRRITAAVRQHGPATMVADEA